MTSVLTAAIDGKIESSEGWSARLVGGNLIEYVDGDATCLVNVEVLPMRRTKAILASESQSDLFPKLKDNLRQCAPMFEGQFVVI